MKKRIFILTLLIVAIVLPAASSLAGTFRSPSMDTLCLKGGQCYNNFGIQITGSNAGATPPEVCSNGQVGYIGWNLSGVTQQITAAKLTLTTSNVTGAGEAVPVVFQLVRPASQTWTEGGNDPGFASAPNVLATASTLLANGATAQKVVFGGAGSPTDAAALGVYLEGLRVGGTASVGLRISGGCLLSTSVTFEDREPVGLSAPAGLFAPAGEPDLVVHPADGPLAVELSALTANGVSATRPWYAAPAWALVLVIAAVLGGIGVWRRHSVAQS